MKRGAVHKKTARPLLVWFPEEVIPLIDKAVVDEDTDRSKFIRKAVREKLDRETTKAGATK